jgi:hypothetical protein
LEENELPTWTPGCLVPKLLSSGVEAVATEKKVKGVA